MNQHLSPNGLRDEWALLLHSFLEEDSIKPELVQQLRQMDVSSVKKELSTKRKKLNQAIEKIKIKIEQVSSVIENLELVGSDTSGLNKEIDFLSREGERISEEIFTLDNKLKKIHELQDQVA
jgi:cell division FtsZ-interacting protein ZapD